VDEREFKEASKLIPVLKEARIVGEKTASKGDNQEFRVVIRGDRMTHALAINQAMNAAGEAGIADVSFSVVNNDNK
jgi:biopolymer transport protein ExbD